MLKKILLVSAVLTIGLLVFSGCNKSEKDKLADLGAQMVCLSKEASEMMDNIDYEDEAAVTALTAKTADIQTRMAKAATDAGYKDLDEAGDAFNDYKDQDELKEAVKNAAKKECGASDEYLDQLFD